MSNCAKLLGAALFFVLATVVSSRGGDFRTIAHQRIALEESCIESRVKIVSQLLDDLDGEPIVEIFPYLIRQLKQNMTASVDMARFLVHYTMDDPLNEIIFNRTECARFLLAYEKKIDDVEARLDAGRGNALNKTIAKLADVLTIITKQLNTVKLLKSEVANCEGNYCVQLVNNANEARRTTYNLTSEFSCGKRKYSYYMRILVEMESAAYFAEIPEVVEQTTRCVRGSELSVRNHF